MNQQAQRDAEEARKAVDPETLRLKIMDPGDEINPEVLWTLDVFTPRAKLTLTRALAYYAAQGAPQPDELAPPVILAWARHLDALIPEPEAPAEAETPPTGDPQ